MVHHLILVIPFLLIASVSSATWVSVHLTGRLFCNGTPYRNQTIEVWEKNFVLGDIPEASTKTDQNGYFEMKADVKDIMFSPTPYFYMINWCVEKLWYIDINGDTISCSDPLKLYIPDKYLTPGREPKVTLDFQNKELTRAKTEFVGLEWLLQGYLGQKGECRRITPDQLATDPFHHYHIPKRPKGTF